MKKAKQGKEFSAIIEDKTNQTGTGSSHKPTRIPSVKPVSNLPLFRNYPFKPCYTTHKGYGCGGSLFVDKVYPHVYNGPHQRNSVSNERGNYGSESGNHTASNLRSRSSLWSNSSSRLRNRNNGSQTISESGMIHFRISCEMLVCLVIILIFILALTGCIDLKMEFSPTPEPKLERDNHGKII